jgi:hypothetical protein
LVVTIGAWNHGKFNDFPFSWEWKIIPQWSPLNDLV